MDSELRKTGISIVGDVPWGTHFCHFYETKQDLLDTLVPYFKAGLESKEFCLWVVSNSELITVEEAKRALEQAVPDLDRHLSNENIEILNGRDWYLEGKVLNLERATRAWDAKLKRALARGYDGMRVSGDTFWLEEKDWKDFCGYEKQLNDSIADRPMTVLCTYPLAKSGAAEILDVVQAHQSAIARRQGEWEVIETPELIQARAEIKRLNEELGQRVAERTSELRVANEDLGKEIADRTQIERELRESQQQFESLVHTIDGIVWEVDTETFTFTFISKQAERILGYPLSQWLEPNFWVDHLHPDDRDGAVGFCVDATQRRVDHQFEYRMIAADGRVVWLRDHVTVNVRMDQSVRLRGVMLDITERKCAEDALTESGRYLQALFDNSLDAILVTNDEGRYIDANPAACALLGYTHEELMQLSIMDLTAEPFRQEGWAMWQQFLARGSQSGEYSTLRKDGTVIQLEFRAVANILPNVHVSSSRDITERKRAEQAQREAEQKYRDIFENAVEGIFQSTPDGRFIAANPALVTMFGFSSAEELIRERADISGQHYVDPKRREGFKRKLEEEGVVKGFELQAYRKDGSTIWLSENVHAVRDERGKVLYYEGTTEDITERRHADHSLRLFRTLIDRSTDAIEVMDPDTLRFLDCNKNAYQVLGYSREEFLALSVYDIDPLLDERMAARLVEEMDRAGFVLFESIHRRKDGSTFPVEINLKTVRLERGYRLAVVRDITERKVAEEELKRSESLLAEAQRLAHVGSWDWDLRSNTVTWSDELYRIFGFQPGEIDVAHEAMSFIHPEDRDLVLSTVKISVKNKEPYSFYYRVLRPDGDERIVYSRGFIVSDEDGDPIRVFGATQDVTERKQSEENLKATSEQLRKLSASLQSAREEEAMRIAREIHDELGAALSSLRWDLEDVDEGISEPREESKIQELRNKIEAMMTLTDTTINSVRRISSELRPIALDALGLVEAIQWQARQFQDRTGIMIQCDCNLENIDLSREQSTAVFRIFQEALTNILRHAKATRINIQMNEEDGEFILKIIDNGRGITEDEKSGQHTLGLLGMRERAHLIVGKIDITGSDGKGTVITVRIPIQY